MLKENYRGPDDKCVMYAMYTKSTGRSVTQNTRFIRVKCGEVQRYRPQTISVTTISATHNVDIGHKLTNII